ncbi:hypothetical protein [Dyella sp.]|jgi:hypothetical protein|uniref:hypothetical protein n=1 Tax=Dyella sp. TaxID=1869338 RepID=UPI002D77EFAC|nr:hypothetical protein [Dyella sp.]HET6431363.1 hypothetical protein [Dyella sp.]
MIVTLRLPLVRYLCAVALAASLPVAAQAAQGEIRFAGAVVAPTCAVDTAQERSAAARPAGALERCGSRAGEAPRSYRRDSVALGDALHGDPLLSYFASYAVNAGAPTATVVVRTYD